MSIKHSDTLSKFAPAYIKAQKRVDHATKNAVNPHLKNKYANLAEVIDTVVPVFNEEGIGVLQFPGWNEGRATVGTMLLHESGEFVMGTAETPIPKADPQGYGAATTYLRRYGQAGAANISQDDDDGESAMDRKPKAQKKSETPADVRAQAKEVAKDPEDPKALAESIKSYIAELAATGKQLKGEEYTQLQGQIREVYNLSQALGRDVYQAARKAGILE